MKFYMHIHIPVSCSISMSGQATSENKYESGIQELFQGLTLMIFRFDIDDILVLNFLT